MNMNIKHNENPADTRTFFQMQRLYRSEMLCHLLHSDCMFHSA